MTGIPLGDGLARASVRSAIGNGRSATTFGGEESKKYSLHSYGAQFAEVAWHPQTARLRVSRFVSVIEAGRILNPKPARNQIEGAVVMGIGCLAPSQREPGQHVQEHGASSQGRQPLQADLLEIPEQAKSGQRKEYQEESGDVDQPCP